jgi:phage terminase large subunit-like protein
MELVNSGKYKRIGIIGKSVREVKDVMIEGQSGLLSTTIAERFFAAEESKASLRSQTSSPRSSFPRTLSSRDSSSRISAPQPYFPQTSDISEKYGSKKCSLGKHSPDKFGKTDKTQNRDMHIYAPSGDKHQCYASTHISPDGGMVLGSKLHGQGYIRSFQEEGAREGRTDAYDAAHSKTRIQDNIMHTYDSSNGELQEETAVFDDDTFFDGVTSDDREIIRFKYYPSKNQISWENGAKAYIIGADNYEKLRGYQFDLVWCDEFAKYKKPEALWQQVMFTLRLGDDPKCIITTTPRPLKILKKLSEAKGTYLTKGSTFDNAKNLSPIFIESIKAEYQGTRVGKQELEGELLMEKENTVWKRENIIYRDVDINNLSRVVIGVDPAVTVGENSDETGIVVAGLGYDEKIYILDDLSGKYKPPDWAKIVCRACLDYKAGRIVAETNNGGDLVGEMLKTIYPNAPFKQTKAIRGKIARAEPISLLYESNRVFHTKEFTELEEQMCDLSYEDKMEGSPDRVDALVWAVSELKARESYNISTIDF